MFHNYQHFAKHKNIPHDDGEGVSITCTVCFSDIHRTICSSKAIMEFRKGLR